MIVEHDSKFFQVIFTKVPRTVIHKRKKRLLIDTTCSIIMKDRLSDLWSEGQVICFGESKQYITDKYSKVIGKRFALISALTIKQIPEHDKDTVLFGNKPFRTALWKKFNETFFGSWR